MFIGALCVAVSFLIAKIKGPMSQVSDSLLVRYSIHCNVSHATKFSFCFLSPAFLIRYYVLFSFEKVQFYTLSDVNLS